MHTLKQNLANKISAIFAIIIVLAVAVGVLLYRHLDARRMPESQKQTISEQNKTGSTIKQTVVDSKGKLTDTSDTPPAPTSISGSTRKAVQVSITSSSQNASTYQVRVLIGGLLNNGTCTLTLTQGSTTVVKTAATEALATVSTCRGFDISLSELTAGQWQLELSVGNATLLGSTTSTITVN